MGTQVGIIAVNAIGDMAPTGTTAGVEHAHVHAAAGAASHGPAAAKKDGMSPLDDVTFDLNFDPATAKQIRCVPDQLRASFRCPTTSTSLVRRPHFICILCNVQTYACRLDYGLVICEHQTAICNFFNV
jgi:hypothetical protein